MGKFGYIGARPTQSSSSSSGVFSVNDVANALDQSIYPLQSFTASYLVIAGGGGGGNDARNSGSAGTGGAGGGGAGGNGNGTAGSANTGGGGGGGGFSGGLASGGAGGSGIVILKVPEGSGIVVGSGLTSSVATSGGFDIYSFTAGTGTVTIG